MVRLAINAVSNLSGGGVTTLAGYLAAWREIGADLDVVVYASHARTIEAVRGVRPDVRVVPFAAGRGTAGRLLALQAGLGRRIRADGADVVLSTNLLLEGAGLPQVVHHQNLVLFDDGSLLRSLHRGPKRALQVYGALRALRRATANVFISDHVRREAEAQVPACRARSFVVTNGLPDETIRESQQPARWDGAPRLLAVTADERHKDNDTLVRTLARLVARRAGVDWTMDVAGDGRFEREKRLARELGMSGRMRWLGFVDPAALAGHYRDALCLLHPAPREGFGLPTLEAMARRCPVVAAGTAAVPGIVGPAALLVDAGDAEGFAEAAGELLDNRALRDELMEQGVRRVAQFRWVESAARFLDVLKKVLAWGAGI
jgi:glycosyltransferase involved in cell wall biosynthesis